MKNSQQHPASAGTEARLDRFGQHLAAGLSQRSEALPADISERLRFAREQALQKAQAARSAQLESARGTSTLLNGRSLSLAPQGAPRWLKIVSSVPLLLLVGGLLLIQHSQWYQQIMSAADIDTQLLSDKLPPAAYSDPGFREYLSDDAEQKEPEQE